MAALCLRALGLGAAAIPLFTGTIAAQATEVCRADGALAEIVSVVGDNQVVSLDGARRPASAGDLLCPGDMLETGPDGSADIRLPTRRTVIGVHNNTEIRLPGPPDTVDLELSYGLMRFLSSVRSLFVIRTPFVDAGIEGTEAIVAALRGSGESLVLVAEGEVVAASRQADAGGKLRLAAGEAAAAGPAFPLRKVDAATAPEPFRSLLIAPDAASDWAIYYPPILLAEAGPDRRVAIAAERLRLGDPDGAEALLRTDLEGGDRVSALALRALIAVFRNRRDEALGLARAAVEAGPGRGPPLVALSYALQASGEIEAARAAAEASTKAAPGDAFAWARLAELELILADPRAGRAAALRSLELAETGLGRSMLGFAALAEYEAVEAAEAFERAIRLDSASPLPRLGLGLALVRRGEVDRGRAEIETAVALDPRRANLRAWLARAYLAEGDAPRARAQIAAAQAADPDDPTPDLFLAEERYAANDPVAALRALRSAERKGGARATVRGRPGLGEDDAARSVALGRVFDTLGFSDAAVLAAGAAVAADPGNPAAHLFLSDAYRSRSGAEIARVSEYLTYQLLLPPSLAPIQPDLGEDDLALLEPGGISRITLHEFGRAFDQEGVQASVAGYAGTQESGAVQSSLTAHRGNLSVGFGQFLSTTDGFRENHDVRHELYEAQAKLETSPSSILTAEVRRRRTEAGDRTLEFALDPDNVRTTLRSTEARLGYSGDLAEGVTLVTLARVVDEDFFGRSAMGRRIDEATGLDLQSLVLADAGAATFSGGASGYVIFEENNRTGSREDHFASLFGYARLEPHPGLEVTVGASLDDVEGFDIVTRVDRGRLVVSPKLGLKATLRDGLTLRAALLRSVQRDQLLSERLEPTLVAGFNQLDSLTADDFAGIVTDRLALGLDARLAPEFFAGVEVVLSEGEFLNGDDLDQLALRFYADAVLSDRVSASLVANYERRESGAVFVLDRTETLTIPLQVSWFDSSGWFGRGAMTFVHHAYRDSSTVPRRGSDQSLSLDAAIGYRFGDGRGVFALEGRNLLGDDIRIQEPTDASFNRGASVGTNALSRDRSLLLTFTAIF